MRVFLEGQEVHAQEVCVNLLKNQPGRALLDISGEKTKLVWAYDDGIAGEEVFFCYKKRQTKRERLEKEPLKMCSNKKNEWKGIKAFAPTAIDAQVRNVPTKLSVAVKDGHSMMFWYMIQRPCPACESGWHWEMFDIRWFGVEQEAWIKKYLGNPDLALQAVKKLIRKQNVFLEIANRVGIGAVDTVA